MMAYCLSSSLIPNYENQTVSEQGFFSGEPCGMEFLNLFMKMGRNYCYKESKPLTR